MIQTEIYIGLTSTEFKSRYNNHTRLFREPKLRNETELSKHIWQLKEWYGKMDLTSHTQQYIW